MHSVFRNIRLAGFSAAVPKNRENIFELMEAADPETRFTLKRVAALAGLRNRHVAPTYLYSGDLAAAGGRSLLKSLNWDPSSVDALFFVSQTPDFLSPPTGYLISQALGLPESSAVMDLTAGCPGMIQGAWLACGSLGNGAKRALILSGDVASKTVPMGDVGNSVLMGDAIGALALEYDEKAHNGISFHLLSVPDADFNLVNYNSGYRRHECSPDGMVMNGNKITEFCLNRVPQCMQEHLTKENSSYEEIDIFYLHQPNKMILDTLQRRLKMDKAKFPQIFADYANCSSASLPINVCRNKKLGGKNMKAMFCAFGSGLAVASMLADWDESRAFEIVELDERLVAAPKGF